MRGVASAWGGRLSHVPLWVAEPGWRFCLAWARRRSCSAARKRTLARSGSMNPAGGAGDAWAGPASRPSLRGSARAFRTFRLRCAQRAVWEARACSSLSRLRLDKRHCSRWPTTRPGTASRRDLASVHSLAPARLLTGARPDCLRVAATVPAFPLEGGAQRSGPPVTGGSDRGTATGDVARGGSALGTGAQPGRSASEEPTSDCGWGVGGPQAAGTGTLALARAASSAVALLPPDIPDTPDCDGAAPNGSEGLAVGKCLLPVRGAAASLAAFLATASSAATKPSGACSTKPSPERPASDRGRPPEPPQWVADSACAPASSPRRPGTVDPAFACERSTKPLSQ